MSIDDDNQNKLVLIGILAGILYGLSVIATGQIQNRFETVDIIINE